ncbi:MAG: metal-dependent hydrolase, partial [Acidimicrobiia bacterium]|nr:metal-dependent hydrolase [Acidimicrobiia bacterium]
MVERPPTPEAAPSSPRTGESHLAVRRIAFDFPAGLDVAWTPARPEFACAANSISLLMPHMEPYFVRSVAAVLDDLEGEVGSAARAYVGQEAAHHREHRRFNHLLTTRYP